MTNNCRAKIGLQGIWKVLSRGWNEGKWGKMDSHLNKVKIYSRDYIYIYIYFFSKKGLTKEK